MTFSFSFFNGIHKDFLIIDFNLEERKAKRDHFVKFHIYKEMHGLLNYLIGVFLIIDRQNLTTKLVVVLLSKMNITTYFENLTVELHILYTLNTHVKFCINQILFTI